MECFGQGLAQRRFAWVAELPPLPSAQGAGGAFFFFWKTPLFEWDIFTFHSLPQIGGICPVPDSDVLSSQAPTNTHQPGRENNKPFLGHICMSSPSLSDCSVVGASRQMEQHRLRWRRVRSALHEELTSKCFLGRIQGGRQGAYS